MTLSLLPLVALPLYKMYEVIKVLPLLILCYAIVFFFAFRADYLILKDFAHASIPLSDRNQYNNDWPAGTGVKEAVSLFRKEAEKKKIFIATQGTFGLMPYALELYLGSNPNITIKGYWPIEDAPPMEVLEKSKSMPTFFLFYQPCAPCKGKGEAPLNWPMHQIFQIEHVNPGNFITVYVVEPHQ
jgi:hypothetical protein